MVVRGCFVYSAAGGGVGLPSWIDCSCPPLNILAQGVFEDGIKLANVKLETE
jgi:hypothetical protein